MLSLGVIVALSFFPAITMDDIDSYKVEKWGNLYNVTLLSERGTDMGNLVLSSPTDRRGEEINSVGVFIGDDEYAVNVTQNIERNRGTAEFLQGGETIGWIDIVKDHNGNIRLKNISSSLDEFTDSFELVMAISKDPVLKRRLANPILLDTMEEEEAFWCGTGGLGASRIHPTIGFLYCVTCGILASMDSWNFGGFGGGGGGGGSNYTYTPGNRSPKVVYIWR